jgi:hypothetical protein
MQKLLNASYRLFRLDANPTLLLTSRGQRTDQKTLKADAQQGIDQQRHQQQREDRSPVAKDLAQFFQAQPHKPPS